jgi:hypothetical protein
MKTTWIELTRFWREPLALAGFGVSHLFSWVGFLFVTASAGVPWKALALGRVNSIQP